MTSPKLKKYTVETQWWTGDEYSTYFVHVLAKNKAEAERKGLKQTELNFEIDISNGDDAPEVLHVYVGHVKEASK